MNTELQKKQNTCKAPKGNKNTPQDLFAITGMRDLVTRHLGSQN